MNYIRKIYNPPVFDDEETNSKVRFLNGFSWLTIFMLLVAIILIGSTGFIQHTIQILVGILFSFVFTLILIRRGLVTLGGIIVTALTWAAVTAQVFLTGGVRDVIVMAYLAIALIASMVINIRAAFIVILASLASIWAATFLEINGQLQPSIDIAQNYARDLTIIFIITASLIYYSTNFLRNALNRTRKLSSELAESNRELLGLQADLESRVELRTQELTELASRNEQRARQLQAVSDVARAAISIQDINVLLPNITHLIAERFNYYHVGIFLVDDSQENVVLVASNSEGGHRMLQRQHQLVIEPSSIVGYVASNRQPRIASDVGKDASYFDNPDMPETRSEMALPMIIGNRLVGVLDVQSRETNAFSQEDIRILGTLVDQVTVAIENARLFEETHKALAQSESIHQRYLGQAWQQFTSRMQLNGYAFDGKKLQPLESGQGRDAADKSPKQDNAIAIPLMVSGQSIGTLNIHPNDNNRQWTEEERGLLDGLAQRAALSLENARLLEDAQRRAAREQIIGEIASKISASTDTEAILRTTVNEIGQRIGGAKVVFEFGLPEVEEQRSKSE